MWETEKTIKEIKEDIEFLKKRIEMRKRIEEISSRLEKIEKRPGKKKSLDSCYDMEKREVLWPSFEDFFEETY